MQLYDTKTEVFIAWGEKRGSFLATYDDAHARLSYENMLSSRYALYNAPPHGREWTIDRSAALLLSRLDVEGPMSIGALAQALDLDISTVHRQVAAAMKAGLIERITDPQGGQARMHQPTTEGLKQLHEEFTQRDQLSRLVTRDWPAAELDTFLHLLTKYNQGLEALRDTRWPRPYPTG